MDAPDLDRFESRRSTVYARNGAVATSQPLAAEAGVAALRDGGNAFDAAVTTAAALNVVEPMSTGIGGDVFALYRTADGDVGAFRSCGGAPADATLDAVRERVSGSGSASMPEAGPLSVTVPGTVRGWERLLDDHGRRSLAAALDPAIEYAAEGFPVSEVIADMWTAAETLFSSDDAREEYLLGGRSPEVGEVMRLPDLASTFRILAEEGADAFYEGPLADRIANAVRERGGLLAADDLAGFEPEYVDPVSTTYGGAEVYELPPNNQGLIAIEALNVAEALDAGSYAYDSAERVHYFAESLKRARGRRHRSPDRRGRGGQRRLAHQLHLRALRERRRRPGDGNHAPEPGEFVLARPGPPQPDRTRQTAVPHPDPGVGPLRPGRLGGLRRDGGVHAATGSPAGPRQPAGLRHAAPSGDGRAAMALPRRRIAGRRGSVPGGRPPETRPARPRRDRPAAIGIRRRADHPTGRRRPLGGDRTSKGRHCDGVLTALQRLRPLA